MSAETTTTAAAAQKQANLFMIAERRNSRGSVPEVFARLKSADLVTAEDEDMYGNVLLHHAFASGNPNFALIQKTLGEKPMGARVRNQFGRIPLHYALDRTKVDIGCFQMLLKVTQLFTELHYSNDVLSNILYFMNTKQFHVLVSKNLSVI